MSRFMFERRECNFGHLIRARCSQRPRPIRSIRWRTHDGGKQYNEPCCKAIAFRDQKIQGPVYEASEIEWTNESRSMLVCLLTMKCACSGHQEELTRSSIACKGEGEVKPQLQSTKARSVISILNNHMQKLPVNSHMASSVCSTFRF